MAEILWPAAAAAAAVSERAAEDAPIVAPCDVATPADDPRPLTRDDLLALGNGPISAETIERLVAERLSDAEFEALSPPLAEAVALRRAGLSVARAAQLLGISDTGLYGRLDRAVKAGVAIRLE